MHISAESFNSFLLSSDNSAFLEEGSHITHDMTRPLSEYYISSSHNTYLVGHQLVGDSTIEGYIRALLHSCRSVECKFHFLFHSKTNIIDYEITYAVDIYDGPLEPMIFHGKTLTSKVSLRQVCKAILRYAFIVSAYPIIISAEIHCGIPQQEQMVQIMLEVFGEKLVRAPFSGNDDDAYIDVIAALPSPEDLKGRILFKVRLCTVMSLDRYESNGLRGRPRT